MPGYDNEPSQMAARRIQREKRRAVFYWVTGAVLLVAAVSGLLVTIYKQRLH